MTRKNIVWLSIVLAAALMAGCSKKEENTEAPPAESASQSAATPIDQSTVATVTGKVKFDGAKPKLATIHMDQDQVCVSKHSSAVHVEDGEVNDNGTLPNVFVYVKEGADKYTFATPTDPVTLDQNGCMYKPHVLGIMADQTLHIISSDATPLFITSAAHRITVPAMIARTSCAVRLSPCGVGMKATASAIAMAIASQAHLTVGFAAATEGGAATGVLIVNIYRIRCSPRNGVARTRDFDGKLALRLTRAS